SRRRARASAPPRVARTSRTKVTSKRREWPTPWPNARLPTSSRGSALRSESARRIYGEAFLRRVQAMGIREVLIAPRAPWQNPFVERVIGPIRRVDQVLILNAAHLRRLLRAYVAYCNTARPHQALDNHCPRLREVEP